MSSEELGRAFGFTFGGGYFTNTLGAMRSGGIIDYPAPGMVSLSEAFTAAAA